MRAHMLESHDVWHVLTGFHTDVAGELGGNSASTLPAWLAWVAILIDYLELPVIFDTLKRLATAVRQRRLPSAPISERL